MALRLTVTVSRRSGGTRLCEVKLSDLASVSRVSQRELADLMGISTRQFQRWG